MFDYFDSYELREALDEISGGFTSFADMYCGDLDDGADALDWMK